MTYQDRTQSHQRGSRTGVRRAGRSRFRYYLAPMMRHVLLVVVAIAFLVPFYWMAISAFKDNSQIFARPLQWWPHPGRALRVAAQGPDRGCSRDPGVVQVVRGTPAESFAAATSRALLAEDIR